MVVHVAIYRWKENVSKEKVEELLRGVKKLKNNIDGVVDIYSGKNFSKWNKGYTHSIVVLAKNKKGLDEYRASPAHKPIAALADEMEEDGIGIDFESI